MFGGNWVSTPVPALFQTSFPEHLALAPRLWGFFARSDRDPPCVPGRLGRVGKRVSSPWQGSPSKKRCPGPARTCRRVSLREVRPSGSLGSLLRGVEGCRWLGEVYCCESIGREHLAEQVFKANHAQIAPFPGVKGGFFGGRGIPAPAGRRGENGGRKCVDQHAGHTLEDRSIPSLT